MGGRKLKVASVATALVMTGAFAAVAAARTHGSAAPAKAAAKYRIGLVLPDLSNLYIAGIRDGAQAQAKKSGVDLLVKGTNDAAGQTNATLAYVGAKVNAIVVDAIDGKAIIPAVKAANKANIPVVAIQSNVYGGKTATFIAGREDLAGKYIGQDAVNWCKNYNPCKIGIVEGIRADQSGATENKAFRAVVGKVPSIKIVGASETQYDPAKALNLASNFLTANPDLNYIYAWWDPGAAAAVKAIQAAGKLGKVGVGAQNGDCIALGLVIKGHQTQTSAFFPSIIGSQGVISAVSAVQGKTLPKYIEAPVLSVTTKLANAWLAGTSQPPAKLRADIMRRLKEAKSGNCPTK